VNREVNDDLFLDILLILIGLAAVVIGITMRYARALLLLFGTYLVSLFAGYLYPSFARLFFALGHGTAWFDALSFTIFFVGGMLRSISAAATIFPIPRCPSWACWISYWAASSDW